MSVVISVYSKEVFKEFLLPSLNNSDYIITFHSADFHLREDLQLKLEVLDQCWRIKKDVRYRVCSGDTAYDGHTLKNNEVLQLRTDDDDDISLIIKNISSSFHVYEKYKLQNIQEITIGKEQGNDIIYDYLGMVSRSHAKILKIPGGYKIQNNSRNGIYVNSLRVDNELELEFGAYINIVGLHMVFLGDMIAIDTENHSVSINTDKLKVHTPYEDETVYLKASKEVSRGKTLYHRAPRYYEKLNEDSIEIEAPPQPVLSKQPPLFMTIGPSLTMALPMLLGCMMMIYASGSAGGRTSLYMYSGLIMSISSAAIGVIWALINIRYQKKQEREQESYRISAYSDYLIEKTDEIKEKYNTTMQRLKDVYPDAETCLNYDECGGILWNRNRTHADFLKHRLGLGDIPFQILMDIPKKGFTLYKDELAEKPEFIKENYETLYQVPVTLDLTEHNLIGIVGGKGKKGALEVSRILSIQLAANNCYTDVKLGYVFDGSTSSNFEKWKFAKWLPHVWSEDRRTRFVASTKEEASDVFYELTRVFRTRLEEKTEHTKQGTPKPYYIIFISDLSLLEGELFAKYVFEESTTYGLTTVLLAERYEELPNECEFIIENTEDFHGMYRVYDAQDEKQKIDFDKVDEGKLECFARYLSSLRVLELEEGGEIPNSLTFFEMLNIHRLEELPIRELWAKSRTYENIRGIIGEKAGGVPCYLDVHEKYHGPHGLVAGTTGSGKSETLQTYMLSLAVNYSPDDIGFFIIDYKGGGMANLFEGLPHMVGQISNLSGNQVRRAMISIKSENRRRQRVFTEHGVNNINLYTKLYKNGEATQPIPHLFIIIDEFAELKREEPEFMKELISVAQVGRSLGVHLILATQKPSGTVDDNIWSNSKFRLCLRVQDQQDSKDMLHKPDAAYITQAGRCYLQVGNDEVYELFQSGFSGAVYDENMSSGNLEIAQLMSMTGKIEMTGNTVKLSQKKRVEEIWVEKLIECLKESLEKAHLSLLACMDAEYKMKQLIEEFYRQMEVHDIDYAESKYNSDRLRDFVKIYVYAVQRQGKEVLPDEMIAIANQKGIKLPQEKEHTQLDAVKEYLAQMAQENGYHHKIQLWMPVLKSHIYLQEFEEYRKDCFTEHGWQDIGKDWTLNMILGLMDDPANQNQMPLIINFAEMGHVAVCGNIVSGKSTMMQTMMFALIQKYSPDMLNIYALDFSSGMMSSFESAPHVGGVMGENTLDRIGKFFNMMNRIAEERKNLFKGGNYKQYVQLNGIKIPAIVIFIDNYGSFKEKTGEAYEEQMIRLSKEGINLGIFLVVSGKGFGMRDITTRVAENIKAVLCLSMQDKYTYAEYLHSNQIDMLPESGIKGRGLALYGDRVLEYQTALALKTENDYQRLEQIQVICKEMRSQWDGKCAEQIPEIPEKPVWSEFSKLEMFEKLAASSDYLPVGYNAANADVYGIPLRETYCYLIYGASRTGKTNFMKICIQSALRKKSQVLIIDSPQKLLKAYEKTETVVYASDEQQIFNLFSDLLPVFKERNALKNQLLSEDYEENAIFDAMSSKIPYFIFISDLSWFVPFVYSAKMDMRGFLENIIGKGYLHNIFFISELELSKRTSLAGYQLYHLFSDYKTGIHFGGKVLDNPILSFDYMPYAQQSKAEKTGVGILPNVSEDDDTSKVIIPLARR